MLKQLVRPIIVWLVFCSAGAVLMLQSNFSWERSSHTTYEIICWTIGGLLSIAGILAPGVILKRKSIDSPKNLLVISVVMASPWGILVGGGGRSWSTYSWIPATVFLWIVMALVMLAFLKLGGTVFKAKQE